MIEVRYLAPSLSYGFEFACFVLVVVFVLLEYLFLEQRPIQPFELGLNQSPVQDHVWIYGFCQIF